MTSEEQKQSGRNGQTQKENTMQTQTFRTFATQNQRCGAAFNERKSIAELLEDAHKNHRDWFTQFDEFSHLSIPGAADIDVCAWLMNEAPNDHLSGYVAGLFEDN